MAIKPDIQRRLLILWALALAFFQFSENTADPDLWAHAMFGEQLLRSGHVQKTEIFSWTAFGQPFVNHEVLAEAALGGAHALGGGSGILLLKMLVGFLTFGVALRLGGSALAVSRRPIAWLVGALAVVEISFGFAARPQIFTALGLALEFWCLRQIYLGKIRWAAALPALFFLWINTHGGVLAGLALLFAAAAANTLQKRGSPLLLWLVSLICAATLLLNPWGFELPRSIVEADLWNRSAIQEWRATPLGWDHAAVFVLLALALISFCFSRRPRAWWEIAMCAVLGLLAIRTVRHTPLFCIAALSFVPPHLADVLDRAGARLAAWRALYLSPLTSVFFVLTAAAMLVCSFTLRKEFPLTMEVPRREYPLAAIQFIRGHDLRGNALMFFDWGELCLWELPHVAVSMDGRMDTCYSHELFEEHWKFYNGLSVNTNILDLDRADLALLPANLAGAAALAARPGWQAVYVDSLAVVLAHNPKRFPGLPRGAWPVHGPLSATVGSAPFPSAPSARVL
ncbi:MAG TPA: hypothetical protein VHB20_06175 [Verrucomicrobiae bacterium]|jgi:hypothetical protein|nr:hypothetical protein [Verrucomicrobiae bacterium]